MANAVPDSLKRVVELTKLGMSFRRMAWQLNAEQVPTARGGKWHIRTIQLAQQQAKELGLL